MEAAEARTALVIGAGGMGAPAALALAAAGVERVLLADPEPLLATDLPVLPLLGEADLGRPRGAALAEALGRLLPDLAIEPVTAPLVPASALALAWRAQVVVDAGDRFPLMFLANDAAVAAGVPLAHAGLLHHTAQLLSVLPGRTGCLRCLFEGPPAPSPAPEPGALGPLAGLAGALLGAEAARLLAGEPGAYAGQLVSWESRSGWSRAVTVRPRPGCPACAAAQALAATRASTASGASPAARPAPEAP